MPPKKRVKKMPPTNDADAISLFLSVHAEKILLNPISNVKETKKRRVEAENRTENFLKFRIKRATIERIPARIAHAAVIPKPIILSDIVRWKHPFPSSV
ncbi:hypothetical protein TRFO_11186 [Tritrichomonas foetus]|uniref:Uncharacterized protein n=1 Tax=Tritrichomonas foetus TaxID=1144522 RepID=A0A1J4J4S6_9EUKA|nr:hypothetical protein TRFO_11186 [Tritrichomonas foetus]|eukprot:OHS94330.1 hypothetical protein TRFO_11186 [Tritrichomonas foetus]